MGGLRGGYKDDQAGRGTARCRIDYFGAGGDQRRNSHARDYAGSGGGRNEGGGGEPGPGNTSAGSNRDVLTLWQGRAVASGRSRQLPASTVGGARGIRDGLRLPTASGHLEGETGGSPHARRSDR